MASAQIARGAKPPVFNRIAAKRRLATWLLERFFVRFHLLLIIAFVFFSGLVASRAAMALGADSPLLRYPLVVLASYAAFLLAVRLWLWYAGFHYGGRKGDWDVGDVDLPSFGSESSGNPVESVPEIHAGGGEFGGGGASGDLTPGLNLNEVQPYEAPSLEVPSVDLGDVGGADEGCGVLVLLLLALAALLAVFGVGVHVLANGPVLLAEAALEAALAAGFFGRLNRIEDPGWVRGAVAASWQYFIVIMSIAVALALAMHSLAPGSRTIVEAFHGLL